MAIRDANRLLDMIAEAMARLAVWREDIEKETKDAELIERIKDAEGRFTRTFYKLAAMIQMLAG